MPFGRRSTKPTGFFAKNMTTSAHAEDIDCSHRSTCRLTPSRRRSASVGWRAFAGSSPVRRRRARSSRFRAATSGSASPRATQDEGFELLDREGLVVELRRERVPTDKTASGGLI